MPQSEPIDPRKSMAAYFVYEMKRHREARGLSQDQQAKEMYTTCASVQAYESQRNRPNEEYAERHCSGHSVDPRS